MINKAVSARLTSDTVSWKFKSPIKAKTTLRLVVVYKRKNLTCARCLKRGKV